jgi:hypothetical protein
MSRIDFHNYFSSKGETKMKLFDLGKKKGKGKKGPNG